MSADSNIETAETGVQRPGRFSKTWEQIRGMVRRNKNVKKTGAASEAGTASIERQVKEPTLQEILDRALAERNIGSPEFLSSGVSEFYSTNETFNPDNFEAVRNGSDAPDGYVIGVGTGSIISSLELFSDETPPKGLVLINIDPATIDDGKKFVNGLKEGKLLHEVAGRIEDSPVDSLRGWDYRQYQQTVGLPPPATEAKWNKAGVAGKLALEGKVAILQQNIFDPRVLEVLNQNLPGISSGRNVVYLSNVGDWIRRDWESKNPGITPRPDNLPDSFSAGFEGYKNFGALAPAAPKFNYFIDTSELPTGGTRPYEQRISKQPPDVTRYTRPPSS